MIDIAKQLQAINRELARQTTTSGETVCVRLTRQYQASVEDVWDAITDPDRVERWFLPLTGELRVGGRFQIEGHAGGDILVCRPPVLLQVTFGGPTSVVEVRLSPEGSDRTRLELAHTVPLEVAMSGAGALYVGPGWDGALMGLGLFLAGEVTGSPIAAARSPEVQEFSAQSVHAWTHIVEASGTATGDEIATAKSVALATFAPDRQEPADQG